MRLVSVWKGGQRMATTPAAAELPRRFEAAPAPTPIATVRAKHWAARHRILIVVLAAVAFVLWTLAAVEFGHWMAEGFPPLLPHLREAFDHMSGLSLKWMW
jgi:hypothetical protein